MLQGKYGNSIKFVEHVKLWRWVRILGFPEQKCYHIQLMWPEGFRSWRSDAIRRTSQRLLVLGKDSASCFSPGMASGQRSSTGTSSLRTSCVLACLGTVLGGPVGADFEWPRLCYPDGERPAPRAKLADFGVAKVRCVHCILPVLHDSSSLPRTH